MKKSVSIGYTMQVDDYEPVKINVMHECDLYEGETEEELTVRLAKGVMGDIELLSKDAVGKVQKLKKEIFDALLDEEG